MQFYKLLPALLLILSIGFFACNSNTGHETIDVGSDNTKIEPIKSLKGQLYFIAPELDSATSRATGGCDCCAGHLLFLNDSDFIAVDYCLGGDTYYKGSYEIEKTVVLFRADSLRVDKEENWEKYETDSGVADLPSFFVKSSKVKIFDFNWTGFNFKGRLCFKTSFGDYSTPDNKEKKDFIKSMKADSIWQKLEIE